MDSQNRYTQKVRVDRFDSRDVVLKMNDQEIRWPIAGLPENINIGDDVFLSIGDNNEKKEIAKEILNEILQNSDG